MSHLEGSFADLAASAALGKNTDLHSTFPLFALPMDGPDGKRVERQVSRWRARSHGRELLRARGLHRLRPASCGFAMAHGVHGVEIFRRPDKGLGLVSGVCNCGQPLLCPVCSSRVAARRSAEVGEGWDRAKARGWKAHLMVFTAPHTKGSALLDEVDFWRDAWDKFMASGRQSQLLKRQRIGHIGGPEITWTVAAGWHFHRNLIVFHDGSLDVEAHKSRWMDCLGIRYKLSAEKHGFHAHEVDDRRMAEYCAKVGAEVAWQEGKSESMTPLTLLVQSAIKGTDCPQWVEACGVVAARKLSIVRWSRGLRAELMMPTEKSDEAVATETAESTDELLGVLTPAQWHRIVASKLEYRLTQEAQLGRENLEVFLSAHGIGELLTHDILSGAVAPVSGNQYIN